MEDKRNLHLKVQELADCYASNDPLREMSVLPSDADQEEAALKWIALAALHGVNANAKKISLRRTGDGQVTVQAKYREGPLPSPGPEVGARILETFKSITHLEGGKGKVPLALGIRNDSLNLKVKLEREGDQETVTIKFTDMPG